MNQRQLGLRQNLSLGRAGHASEEENRGDAGEKKIAAALHGYKARYAREPAPHAVSLDGEDARLEGVDRVAWFDIVANQRIAVVVEAVELGVIAPCLLDKLELPLDVGIDA